MATGMKGASSIIDTLKYSPIRQLELQEAQGKDNRAVSQEDRMIGRQVANEQSKLLASQKFGDELAMRKDKLAFAKKVQSESKAMAEERQKMAEDEFGHKSIFKGIEFGIGLAGAGAGYYRSRKAKEQAAITKKKNEENFATLMKTLGARTPALIGKTIIHGGVVKDDFGG